MQRSPWTNVYGLARSIMAFSTLSTLMFHGPDQVFRPLGHDLGTARHDWIIDNISLFSLAGPDRLNFARWFAVAILVLVMSGWRPRITGILHWWVSFSFAAGTFLLEGGDQVIANFAFFMIPLTLTDRRVWHWQADTSESTSLGAEASRIVASSCITIMRLQVAVIYLHAAIGKLQVPQWLNGTAFYYWMLHPAFGLPDAVRPAAVWFMSNVYVVTAVTWGVIAFELLLFLGLAMDRRYRPYLLVAGLAFHFGIIVVHGLGTFFCAMAGALIVYLRPVDEPFSFAWISDAFRRARVRIRRVQSLPTLQPAMPAIAHGQPESN